MLERNPDIGKKIRISGGGRCNFTNISPELLDGFHSSGDRADAEFFKSVLSRYRPEDFIALMDKHGIKYHEKKLGQLFCDESAGQIVEMLRQECDDAGVRILTDCLVTDLAPGDEEAAARFQVDYLTLPGRRQKGQARHKIYANMDRLEPRQLTAEAIVVASGGLSYERSCGSTDLAYQIATRFRMPLHDIRPGLVPMRCDGEEMLWVREIPGVVLPVRASVGEVSFHENLLFTHRGVSGPVVLQISSFLGEDGVAEIDLIPDRKERELDRWLRYYSQRHPKHFAVTAVRELMPREGGSGFKRLADAWWSNVGAKGCGVAEDARFGDISTKGWLRRLAKQLKRWRVRFDGSEGYPKAEVTCGGVGTEALAPDSMEAKEWPGLFFVGEAVDVTGWLGGYNLQWAWASGHAAGEAC